MSRIPNTVSGARVVLCCVGGRHQKWLFKVRKSGLLAIFPMRETWNEIVSQVLDRALTINK